MKSLHFFYCNGSEPLMAIGGCFRAIEIDCYRYHLNDCFQNSTDLLGRERELIVIGFRYVILSA